MVERDKHSGAHDAAAGQHGCRDARVAAASSQQIDTPEVSHLRRSYLCVWFLAAFADWLQGPYFWAVYDQYGYKPAQISMLFVAGVSLNRCQIAKIARAPRLTTRDLPFCFPHRFRVRDTAWNPTWINGRQLWSQASGHGVFLHVRFGK